jgi:hypothetical protein
MAIFRGVGGSGDSSDNSFLQEVTAQANAASASASAASASASAASASASSILNLTAATGAAGTDASYNASTGVLTIPRGDAGVDAVVDTSSVSAAGAIMDSDFSTNGFMKRTGSGSYTVDTNTYLTSHQDISGKADLTGANFTGGVSVSGGNLDVGELGGNQNLNVLGNIIVSGTVDGVDIASLNTTVAGKANLSGATFTGNVEIGLPPSGTQSLTVSGSSSLYGGANVTGDITVSGTVDGRDVAADGAKIDAIGRFSYGDSQAKGVSGTTTHTMLSFSAPAPTSGTVVRSINGSVQIRFFLQSSQTAPRNLAYRTYLEMQSTSQTGTSLGTATYSSTPAGYHAWYYVTGNKTDKISPYRGRIGSSSTGANSSVIYGCYYDATLNRTFIRITNYPNAATIFNNVEIFYSPTNFYSEGTYVAPYLANDNYMRLEAINYYDTRLQLFNEIFPRTSDALYLRMRHRNTTGSTGVSIIAFNNQGYIEATP